MPLSVAPMFFLMDRSLIFVKPPFETVGQAMARRMNLRNNNNTITTMPAPYIIACAMNHVPIGLPS